MRDPIRAAERELSKLIAEADSCPGGQRAVEIREALDRIRGEAYDARFRLLNRTMKREAA